MVDLLIDAFRFHCDVPQVDVGDPPTDANVARANHWLSTSPVITEPQSPYKGCVIVKFLHQDGQEIVVRSMYIDQAANKVCGPMNALESRRTTRMRGSIGTMVQAMLKSAAWWDQSVVMTDDQLSELVGKITETYEAKKAAHATDLTFEWLDDVQEAYRSWDTESHSCMSGERCDNTEVYDRTVGGRRIWALQARDSTGGFVGRCLIIKPSIASTIAGVIAEEPLAEGDVPWNADSSGWFAHRIYGSGGGAGYDHDGIRRMAGGVMKAFPWIQHELPPSASILATIPRSMRLPYLDGHGSFLIENERPGGRIILVFGQNPKGLWRSHSAANYEGGPLLDPEDDYVCNDCDRGVAEDDVCHVDGEPICPRCLERSYCWSEVSEEYVNRENVVQLTTGEWADRDSLPIDYNGIEYVLAEDADGNEVGAPTDDVICVFYNGDEEGRIYVDGRNRHHVVKAKVVKLPDAMDKIEHLVVTDEEIDVYAIQSGQRSNWMWCDDDGQWYVCRTCMPFAGDPGVSIHVEHDAVYFKHDGHRIGFRASGTTPGHLMCYSERDRWSMYDSIRSQYVVENITYYLTKESNNVAYLDIIAHTVHAPSLNDLMGVNVNGAGYCIVNDERTGCIRLVKANFDFTDGIGFENELVSLVKRIARTCRFAPGRYTIIHETNESRPSFLISGTAHDSIIGVNGGSIRFSTNTNSFQRIDNVDSI